jgi:hypothetical protein
VRLEYNNETNKMTEYESVEKHFWYVIGLTQFRQDEGNQNDVMR